jgi:type II secretory pathway pseudopilin PulG
MSGQATNFGAWRRLRRSPRRSAYTLIEMVLVVVILGFITLITVRGLGSVLPRNRLQASAREVASTVQSARDQAVLTSRGSSLRFDLDGGVYWIVLPSPTGDVTSLFVKTSDGLEEIGGDALSHRRLHKGVRFADIRAGGDDEVPAGVLSVDISPLGAFPDLVVHLENEQQAVVTLHINGVTGIPAFHDGFKSYEELRPVFLPR